MYIENVKSAFLITSFLLQYPDDNWYETLEEVYEEVEKIKGETYISPISKFLSFAKNTPPLDLGELYVKTFELTRKTNLYLTYYKFNNDKERGMALLTLKQRYAKAGYQLSEKELPDFLPVMLEFASAAGSDDILRDFAVNLQDIYFDLLKSNNPYSQVFEAILRMIGAHVNARYVPMGGAIV